MEKGVDFLVEPRYKKDFTYPEACWGCGVVRPERLWRIRFQRKNDDDRRGLALTLICDSCFIKFKKIIVEVNVSPIPRFPRYELMKTTIEKKEEYLIIDTDVGYTPQALGWYGSKEAVLSIVEILNKEEDRKRKHENGSDDSLDS